MTILVAFFEDADLEIETQLRERELKNKANWAEDIALAKNNLGYIYDRSLATALKRNENEAQRLLRLEQGKSGPRDEQSVITSSDVQLGASSSSKPEDTQLTVEEAKEVFTKGKGRPKSVLTIPDTELPVFFK